jgi:hypothetical protein
MPSRGPGARDDAEQISVVNVQDSARLQDRPSDTGEGTPPEAQHYRRPDAAQRPRPRNQYAPPVNYQELQQHEADAPYPQRNKALKTQPNMSYGNSYDSQRLQSPSQQH